MAQKRSSSGDKRRLFEEQALPHLDALYTMAMRLARDRDEASDLVQETLLRAYRFFHQYEPGTNCRAWLLTILFNNFRNGYRRSTRERVSSSAEDFEHKLESASLRDERADTDPETILSAELLDEEVEAALNGLPEDFRSALMIIDVEELSYQEAAEALDVPVGTVKSRVSRGRTMMRQALWEYAKARGINRS